jgi:DNA-binding transcriptional LysR family regulator
MYNLTFDQLHTVRTIVGTGSFHEASKILCLTQPAISQRVRHIERMLGIAIFDRHSGVGVTLTPAGEALLEFCERSIRSLDRFSAELEAVRSPSGGSALRIMASSDIIQYILVPMLTGFQCRHPQLEVRVRQSADRGEVLRMLTSGKVDLAFARSPTHPSLVPLARMSEQLHLVVPAGHELLSLPAGDRRLAIGKYPFAVYAPGMRSRDLIQRWAAKTGVVIAPLIESRSVAVMKDAVLQHGTVSILPTTAVGCEVHDGTLVLADIADMPLTRTTVIAARQDDERAPQIRAFIEELIANCGARPDGLAAEIRWAAPPAEHPPAGRRRLLLDGGGAALDDKRGAELCGQPLVALEHPLGVGAGGDERPPVGQPALGAADRPAQRCRAADFPAQLDRMEPDGTKLLAVYVQFQERRAPPRLVAMR